MSVSLEVSAKSHSSQKQVQMLYWFPCATGGIGSSDHPHITGRPKLFVHSRACDIVRSSRIWSKRTHSMHQPSVFARKASSTLGTCQAAIKHQDLSLE